MYNNLLITKAILLNSTSKVKTNILGSGNNNLIRKYVKDKLKIGWSPEQIAGRLPLDHPRQRISHEAIYQFIYQQFYRHGYGVLKKDGEDLRIYLKRRHKRRLPKGARRCQRVNKPFIPSIETRPEEVNKRIKLGHWESDSIVSGRSTAGLNTLVERVSGFVCISKIKDSTAESTKKAIVSRFNSLPPKVRKTITFDNGHENACWKDLQEALKLSCYFAHPYSSWERGTNENTNGLIRWYLPKGTDFATIHDKSIQDIEYALNIRPRKRLGFKTPLEVFNQGVALQG
jgi:IS30 family transposase